MSTRRFRYMRSDFGPLPLKLHHMDITLRFYEDRVEAENHLQLEAVAAQDLIALDANNLEVRSVHFNPHPEDPHSAQPAAFRTDPARNKLFITPSRPLQPGDRFAVATHTICFPSDHLLEGIYRDVTPPGAPQQYMSQCQQWGFQRIMPVLDDCRAKCTFTTTLEGDARYTHLISNGNVSRTHNPDGVPVPLENDPTRKRITYHNPIPMAPYLFIACAGTWDELCDSITYPSGRTVRLEYLVPPGKVDQARIPMEILKDAILWIHQTQGYEYPGETYRTICMTKSNFGGMENVGNTTIVTDAALVGEHSLDSHLLYAHAVIVHEFEHNQCGSETTMETPFDMWLNEAYTVDVERRYMASVFDPTFMRLHQVDSIRNPLLGPLAIEDGGHAGRIVREGFNDPDELVDGVTYVKAAEVIRMLRLMLGEDTFEKGKHLYFTRYRHGNANTDQFFQCFEETSGRSLETFKKQWLHTLGYPKVTATCAYNEANGTFTVDFRQEVPPGSRPFPVPMQLALVDRRGRDIPGTSRTILLEGFQDRLVLEGLSEAPAFASLNRHMSFYGTFRMEGVSMETLRAQALLDPHAFNRVEAFRQLTDRQRLRLVQDPDREVDPQWLDLYGVFLRDDTLSPALRSFFLRIDEQPLDRRYATRFPELVTARERLMEAVNRRFHHDLIQLFHKIHTHHPPAHPRDGLEDRMLKATVTELIAVADTPEVHRLLYEHFRQATTANDRVSALMALNRSSWPERTHLMEETYRAWHSDVSGYANYLKVVASRTQPDVFEAIAEEKARATFDITHPTLSRALLVTMALNTKRVWTPQGIHWIRDHVVELAPVNTTVASRLLNTFQHVARLQDNVKPLVLEALEEIRRRVSQDVCPTVAGQAAAYLEGLG
ncbi:aminopeptidase N [Desulfacinum hydrothermale DSM 13146]|uniref:Aminopeptidase N n=1 Tax=Desulfacinum hydrothermale DSM 13146 TaxID=1121390 RepID=A0A1W1XGI7_9BACT|nr:M1 family metallopeptidase [Desulfacinum hydrothermale]SMC23105.1 aminopeptidase N [Desulfacinum hydrothermale DSM 13146]